MLYFEWLNTVSKTTLFPWQTVSYKTLLSFSFFINHNAIFLLLYTAHIFAIIIIMKSPVLLPQCPGVSGSLEGKEPVSQERQRIPGPEEERTHCEKSLMKADTGVSHWRILTSECEPDPLHSAFHWNCTVGHFNHLLLWYMNIWHLYQKEFKSDMTQDANCQTAERIGLQRARIQPFNSHCMSV